LDFGQCLIFFNKARFGSRIVFHLQARQVPNLVHPSHKVILIHRTCECSHLYRLPRLTTEAQPASETVCFIKI